MTQGDKFTFQDKEYTIDLIGPKQTLLTDQDKNWQLIETELLQHFLENQQ